MNKSLAWKLVISAVCLTAVGLVLVSLSSTGDQHLLPHPADTARQMARLEPSSHSKRSTSTIVRTAEDMQRFGVPQATVKAAANIATKTATLTMPQGGSVFYQYALPPPGTPKGEFVLLLHGAAFSSQNWVDLGTLSLLAAMGHVAVAADITGFGRSTGESGPQSSFVSSLLQQLRQEAPLSGPEVAPFIAKPPVLVSPSMSGGYTIPVLVNEASKRSDKGADEANIISGFVAVAPVATAQLTQELAANVQIPTLILYGDRDKGLGKSSVNDLRHIPGSTVVEIPNAGHAAYINQPELFHKLLYNFLTYLGQDRATSSR